MRPVRAQAIHPGEVLSEVYIREAWPPWTVPAVSQAIGLSDEEVVDLLHGRRDVTPDIAARLGVLCRTTQQYWLSLQATYDRQAGKKRLRVAA
ncbi:HigA family addiction module antitoxin [Nitrospira moscoviensis]|uniref:Plasmid maintenance system antidote protein, XRE family n=1 Tax=Nitrospira moscoviensis TaxID=42253 RepID=A0A0K2GKE0_NITMO|nr:HigA family addiction module antitoxin [Nitrospira moscoviensis]ALA61097.1 Plasmid maintenance system antidote protein, XRE family [Nitrospira moscoviensis]